MWKEQVKHVEETSVQAADYDYSIPDENQRKRTNQRNNE